MSYPGYEVGAGYGVGIQQPEHKEEAFGIARGPQRVSLNRDSIPMPDGPVHDGKSLVPVLVETLTNLMMELAHINNRMDELRVQMGSQAVDQNDKVNPSPTNLQQLASQCMQFTRSIDYKLRELGV